MALKLDLPIKNARKKAGLTQKEMSKLLQIPIPTIEKWDRGLSSPPKWAEKLVIEKIEEYANNKGPSD